MAIMSLSDAHVRVDIRFASHYCCGEAIRAALRDKRREEAMHGPLHTPICDELGIEYPVFLAGMGGVSHSKLVAAASNAGGLGVMGAATLDATQLRDEIRRTRELTYRPVAVDLLAPIPDRKSTR